MRYRILMEKEEINTVCNIFIAFSSFLGVGGALAYYVREILKFGNEMLFILLVIYFILGIILLSFAKEAVKNGKDKSGNQMDQK